MYRIFCESYRNYISGFNGAEDDVRLKIAEPLYLIINSDVLKTESENNSNIYKLLCDVLYYASQNIDRFPRVKAFLWTIESRGIKPIYIGIYDDTFLEEHVKLIHSFLKLSYWD